MFYVVGTAWTNANSVRTMTKIIAPSMAATEKLEMEATPTLRFATHQLIYWIGRLCLYLARPNRTTKLTNRSIRSRRPTRTIITG